MSFFRREIDHGMLEVNAPGLGITKADANRLVERLRGICQAFPLICEVCGSLDLGMTTRAVVLRNRVTLTAVTRCPQCGARKTHGPIEARATAE